MSGTAVFRCAKCSDRPHSQDKLHAPGMRVHNLMANGQWRCTVCSTVRGDIKAVSDKKK